MMSGSNFIASRTILKLRPLQFTVITLIRLELVLSFALVNVGFNPLASDLLSSARTSVVNIQEQQINKLIFVFIKKFEAKHKDRPIIPHAHIGGILSADIESCFKIHDKKIIRFNEPDIIRKNQPV